MPLIQVHQTPGQTVEQKRELVRALTDTYVKFTGAAEENVWITIHETSRDDWAIGGRTLNDHASSR
jgi:4-oxalocrotonate tautomerase